MREDMEDFCSSFSYMHSWVSMLFRKKDSKLLFQCTAAGGHTQPHQT